MNEKLRQLAQILEGEFYTDDTMRIIYATDASAYREMPLAVAVPKTKEDIKKLIAFARAEKTSLIPRTAGTSLAGQVAATASSLTYQKTSHKYLNLTRKKMGACSTRLFVFGLKPQRQTAL